MAFNRVGPYFATGKRAGERMQIVSTFLFFVCVSSLLSITVQVRDESERQKLTLQIDLYASPGDVE